MKKKILKKLLNNLPLKILSILIAIVIWYVVVSVNDTRLRRNTRRSQLLSRITTRLSAG